MVHSLKKKKKEDLWSIVGQYDGLQKKQWMDKFKNDACSLTTKTKDLSTEAVSHWLSS